MTTVFSTFDSKAAFIGPLPNYDHYPMPDPTVGSPKRASEANFPPSVKRARLWKTGVLRTEDSKASNMIPPSVGPRIATGAFNLAPPGSPKITMRAIAPPNQKAIHRLRRTPDFSDSSDTEDGSDTEIDDGTDQPPPPKRSRLQRRNGYSGSPPTPSYVVHASDSEDDEIIPETPEAPIITIFDDVESPSLLDDSDTQPYE